MPKDGRLLETDDAVPSLSRIDELKLLPLNRLREFRRIVIVEATGLPPFTEIDPEREEVRDGESDGGGSLDLADWTLSSSCCILPMRPRIWNKEPDLGRLLCWLSFSLRGELIELIELPKLAGFVKLMRDVAVDAEERVLLLALPVVRDREDLLGLASYIDREPMRDSDPDAFWSGNPAVA